MKKVEKFHQYKSPILINNIDINEVVVSKKFPFGKQDFKYFIGYNDNKEIRPLCIFFPEMSIYKRYSDKTKCMCFMIKDEKVFDKYMTFWEKVTSITCELICNKNYLKAKKRDNTNESFQSFYMPVILFDLVYKKDGNYYPKVFLKKLIHNFFGRSITRFCFWGTWKFLLKYNKSFKLEAKMFCFLKYKKLFEMYFLREQFCKRIF